MPRADGAWDAVRSLMPASPAPDNATLEGGDRALGYFLAAAEGPANYPPTSWAISQLYIWRAKQRSWQDLPAADVYPPRSG